MRFRKIAGVEKSVCTAEQKIAYNFAFRYREFDGNKELCQLLAVVSAGIKNNDKIMRNYDIDSIVHCLRNGYFEYPDFEGILEVKRKSKDGRWSTAMFYRNGSKPTFAQYGSEINDVVEWRHKGG